MTHINVAVRSARARLRLVLAWQSRFAVLVALLAVVVVAVDLASSGRLLG